MVESQPDKNLARIVGHHYGKEHGTRHGHWVSKVFTGTFFWSGALYVYIYIYTHTPEVLNIKTH